MVYVQLMIFKKGDKLKYKGKGFLGFDKNDPDMTLIEETNFDFLVKYKDFEMLVKKHEVDLVK